MPMAATKNGCSWVLSRAAEKGVLVAPAVEEEEVPFPEEVVVPLLVLLMVEPTGVVLKGVPVGIGVVVAPVPVLLPRRFDQSGQDKSSNL